MTTMIGADERVQLRLDPVLRERFLALCSKHRVGASAVIRAAMQCAVEADELPQPQATEYRVVSQLELFEKHPNTNPKPIRFD